MFADLQPYEQLDWQLLCTYKTIKERRKDCSINRFLYNLFFRSISENEKRTGIKSDYGSEELLQECLNESYRICAQFFDDDNPLADVEYEYYIEVKKDCGDICFPIVISFVIELLEWYKALSTKKIENEHDTQTIITFMEELRSLISYSKYKQDYICETACLRDGTFPEEGVKKLDLKPQPTPVDELMPLFNAESVSYVTNGYNQKTIRKIISRYKSKEEQLQLLDIFQNVFNGKTPEGYTIYDPNDLPF